MAAKSPGKKFLDKGFSVDDGNLAIPINTSLGEGFSSLPIPNRQGHFTSAEKEPVQVILNGKKYIYK